MSYAKLFGMTLGLLGLLCYFGTVLYHSQWKADRALQMDTLGTALLVAAFFVLLFS